jgi:hypothetical protein
MPMSRRRRFIGRPPRFREVLAGRGRGSLIRE